MPLFLSISKTYRDLLRLFSRLPRSSRINYWLLLPLSFFPGLIDLASVAVIARLTGALLGAQLSNLIPGLKVFGGDTFNQSLWLIGIFILLSWLGSSSKLLLRLYQYRLTSQVWCDLSSLLYSTLLDQSNVGNAEQSQSRYSSILLVNSYRVAESTIIPFLMLFAAIPSIVLLSIGMFLVGHWLSVWIVFSLISAYLAVSLIVTPHLRDASRKRLYHQEYSSQLIYDSFATASDIRLYHVEALFKKRYLQSIKNAKPYVWITHLLPEVPRAVIEPFGISMIFVLGALPALVSGDAQRAADVIPFLASIAVAALRLTPPLQDAFRSITKLRGGLPDIQELLNILSNSPDYYYHQVSRNGNSLATPLRATQSISMCGVSFAYTGNSPVFNCISFTIPVGSRTAFVGKTGSGKTTAANIILGLLKPTAGNILIDGVPLQDDELVAWQANCSHVSQNISLLRGSVIENVAFGIEPEYIDRQKVWDCLQMAQMADVVADLQYGLFTPIGENGAMLSGGQRQRLALARAFYRDCRLLVLDEATSALDKSTEADVNDAIQLIARRCTIIVIAHRLDTIKSCDRLIEFGDKGIRIANSIEELASSSPDFRKSLKLNSLQ